MRLYALSLIKTRSETQIQFYIICFINGSWLQTKCFFSSFFLNDDFYAIKHNGTKENVPWNCSLFRRDAPMWLWIFWVSEAIGPHVNMRIAIGLTRHLLLPYFTCTTATFCFVENKHSFVKMRCTTV